MRVCLIVLLLVAGCATEPFGSPPPTDADLAELFEAWRNFQKPRLVDGIPQYTPDATSDHFIALTAWQEKLAAIDTSGWAIADRVDWHIVEAEMNGLAFDHHVLRPWENNPAFYVQLFPSQSDVPAREGPVVFGAIELWQYPFPLGDEDVDRLTAQLRTVRPLLRQARKNLAGDGRDLWVMGAGALEAQVTDLAHLAERVDSSRSALLETIQEASQATADLAKWVTRQAESKRGPSGVGRAQYTWYLQQVHLLPYTWEDEVALMTRELSRAHTALRLEEHRNRNLPPLERIADPAEYDRLMGDAVTAFMAFLDEADIQTVEPYMDPALRERLGRFQPADGLRSFFQEVNYRDAVVMRTHGYHWFDLARMKAAPHPRPVRRKPLLYNIFDSRAEGMATAMEEWMMHAGLFDQSPRSRELIWILVAQRAARALGGLYMHANEMTLDEASAFAAKWTPRGWLPEDSDLVRWEQHLYLQQPEYGSSYLSGKNLLESLLADYARMKGDAFEMRDFMDDLNDVGMIPVPLIRWELTGDPSDLPK